VTRLRIVGPDDTPDPAEPEPADDPPGVQLAVPAETTPATAAQDAVVRWDEPVQPLLPIRVTIIVVRGAAIAATHERTRTAAKTTARHAAYIPVGAGVVARRLWEAKTSSRYERMMRAAEAAGNWEELKEWEQRAEQARERRHRRRMAWLAAPFAFAKSLGAALITAVVFLLLLGVAIAFATRDPRDVYAPLAGTVHLIGDVAVIVGIAWSPLVFASPWLGLGWLWHIGRTSGAGPAWITRTDPEHGDTNMIVTCDVIALALQNLRIPEMRRAFKDGWIPVFSLPPVRDGLGYHAIVSLPLGVTPQMVADQCPVLARNLQRAQVETWPADAEKAGTGKAGELDLWMADPGALSKAAPEYPLLHEGTADVFVGVPAGVSPRGDLIAVPVVSNNFVAGGQMGQGKSNACRVILLGCALDPLCTIDAFVFANNGDFDAYKPRLANYHRGIDDDTAYAALIRLRWLYGEVGRREGRLAELGAKKVTRKLAQDHPDLRPIVSLYSECHELFGHPEYGEEAAELACKTAKRARKTAIVLGFDTQSSRKEAIPPKLVELVSVNICFYVKTWRSNDGFLGDGSFQAGIRATELRPGRDRGTSLITGVSDNSFELLKWYFVEVDDDTGWDAATDVIARAVAQLAPGTHAEAPPTLPAVVEDRDLLVDLGAVLGDELVPAADVPALLARHAPAWVPYRAMTGKALREVLASEHGIKVPSTGNRYPLDPATVRQALAQRRAE
jgi:S-DNA-T family DNA segregation ATPase FtsK/SpoIIIE